MSRELLECCVGGVDQVRLTERSAHACARQAGVLGAADAACAECIRPELTCMVFAYVVGLSVRALRNVKSSNGFRAGASGCSTYVCTSYRWILQRRHAICNNMPP